jgi:hypothetical protein
LNKSYVQVILFATCMSSTFCAAFASPCDDLFPLKVGNTWTYKVTDQKGKTSQLKCTVAVPSGGNVGKTLFRLSAGDTVKVYTKRDGKTFLESIEFPGKPAENVEFTPAKLVIDTNIRTDNLWKWNGKRSKGNSENDHWQVFPNEKVKVPAGDFDCVRVGGLSVHDGLMVYQTCWYAKNVGVVKSVDVQGSAKTSRELIKYHVN